MTTPPPETPVAEETLEQIADRIAYKYLDKTVGSAKLKSDILSALRNERERCAKTAFETIKALGDSVYEYSVTQKAAMVAAAIR